MASGYMAKDGAKGKKKIKSTMNPLTIKEIGTLKRPLDKFEKKTVADHQKQMSRNADRFSR